MGSEALPHDGRLRRGRKTKPTTFETLTTQAPDISFSSGVKPSKRSPTWRLSSEPYSSLLGPLLIEGLDALLEKLG